MGKKLQPSYYVRYLRYLGRYIDEHLNWPYMLTISARNLLKPMLCFVNVVTM